jgi:TRAP transporter 4TM/12TM fusion protein
VLAKTIEIIAGLFALYQIVIASRLLSWLGIFVPAPQHRAVSLFFVLLLVFYRRSFRGEKRETRVSWYDFLALLSGWIGIGYVAFNYGAILDYSLYGYLDISGIILASLAAFSLLEASRRVAGIILPLLVIAFLLITLFQNYLPGLLYGKGYALDRLTYSFYAGGAGIFGMPLGVATTILISFIIFGQLLEKSGAGEWMIRLALSLAGWTAGGPAKVAVVASGFFGMISGSPSANVATTGSFTIPLMKKTGYPAKFAGAVEAVASTGGQFMPPVMGAIVFIMAEWLNIPYARIVGMAIIPALLYYLVLFISIHLEAKKQGLEAIPRQELTPLLTVLKEGWFYLIPLFTLIYFLIWKRYPPEMAVIASVPFLIAISFFSPHRTRYLTHIRIWQALIQAVKSWLTVAVITATVGILVSSLELSGLGIKFSRFMVDLSYGHLLPALMMVGIASFILGMGLDSIPCYITLTILAAPTLVTLGIPVEIAHLYVIYWGLASFFTPPVCLAVYVACGISGSKIWETGWEAVRLGVAVFVIPIAFVYNQALLGRGAAGEIIAAVVTALLGGVLVAAAMRGYFIDRLSSWGRLLTFGGGLILIGPTNLWTVIFGLGVSILGIFGHKLLIKKL